MRVEVPRQLCPNCGYLLDSATKVGGRSLKVYPKPGDLTICLNCGTLLEFDPKMMVKVFSESRYGELSPDLLRLVRLTQKVRVEYVDRDLRKKEGKA